jgi:ABC-type Na+ efflux pump permease subunit
VSEWSSFHFVVLEAWLLLAVALRAARSVARERQRGTLEAMLLLPYSSRELLAAKWWGAVRAGVGPAAALAAYLAVSLAAWPVSSLPGACLLAVTVAAQVALAASLGLAMSVRCQSSSLAAILTVTGLLAVLVPPSVLAPSMVPGMVPVAYWRVIMTFEGQSPEVVTAQIAPGVALLVLLQAAAWFDARRRFDRRD